MGILITQSPSLFPPVSAFKSSLLLTCSSKYWISTKNLDTRNTGALLVLRCSSSPSIPSSSPGPKVRKRTRYRKLYPGENQGITEEMRFVAMRLRNINGKKCSPADNKSDTESEEEREKKEDEEGDEEEDEEEEGGEDSNTDSVRNGETWKPSMEGFLKYLVDSKLVFSTVERIVDESEDVSYAYFRKTKLERSGALTKDLKWFSRQELVIPEPSSPGITYVKYLEELAERSAPMFLSHFYNIYFSHIAGGQVIGRKVSEKLLKGRELEFYKWDADESELLKSVREKLNMLGEHWSRDDKNKCLKETTKSFRYLGQLVRLIIL